MGYGITFHVGNIGGACRFWIWNNIPRKEQRELHVITLFGVILHVEITKSYMYDRSVLKFSM